MEEQMPACVCQTIFNTTLMQIDWDKMPLTKHTGIEIKTVTTSSVCNPPPEEMVISRPRCRRKKKDPLFSNPLRASIRLERTLNSYHGVRGGSFEAWIAAAPPSKQNKAFSISPGSFFQELLPRVAMVEPPVSF
jgi:hypothetical protein